MTGQQLKNSILQLAIQGKLVPQDPNDEPASVLLQCIRKEKEQLVKEGKLKKKDLISEPITDDEKPFDIPESWEWCRLGEIVMNRDSERVPLSVSVRQTQSNRIYDYYGPGGAFDKVDGYIFDKRLLLIGEDGANLLTRTKPNAFFAEGKYWVNNHVHVLDNYITEEILLDYIAMRINGMSLADYVTGTAQPKMNQEKMNSILIPLPPLSEQQRIVAKIEELMPLVEDYDKAQKELDDLNEKLPEQLKKSILQQAIMGKLVPQDPADEPASVLLQRIRKEKEQLVKEGKLKKKDLETTPIADDEKPFEIPESWEWCRLGEIISIKSGDGLTSKEMQTGSIPVFGGNGITGYHNDNNVSTETIVIGRVGYYCGSVHITPSKAWVTDNAFITSYPEQSIDRFYLVYILRFLDLGKSHNATAQPVVSGKKIYPLLFPLPPLSEQQRIVAKIEELFALLK